MAKCQATTRKGQPCPNETETYDPTSKTWLCHLHHPRSLFRQQVAEKRNWRNRISRTTGQDPLSVPSKHLRRWPPPDTAPLKDRH